MRLVRLSVLQILIFIEVLLSPESIYSQRVNNYRSSPDLSVIDTSDYIPLIYNEALDYNLMIAASKGYDTEISRLIGKGAHLNAETDEGANCLIMAVANNRLSAVKTLLKYNPVLDKVTNSFETPLLIAVKNRNFEISETLIRAGAQIDFPDIYGATPLHHASLYGFMDIVDLLLYYDAPIDEKTDEGTTPLLAAIWAGNTDVSDLLIQNGADPNEKDNNGFTPFLMASFTGDTLIMNLLNRKGADIYTKNNAGQNALILTLLSGQTDAAKLLFKIGKRWSDPVNISIDPYRVALDYRRKDIINILEENNILGHPKNHINQVSITASSRFSLNDFYTGMSIALKDPWLNAGIIAGCDVKLWYTRVLIRDADHLFYQYMDKGSVAYAGLFKDFAITDRPHRVNYLFSTSLLTGYSFGNKLKGTQIAPENKIRIIPSISLKIISMSFSLIVGMEYIKTEYHQNGPLWIRAGISYNYFSNKVKATVKPIRWY
jgi:ankyrin repeat protein